MENFTFCAVFIKKGLAHLFSFSFSENVSSSKKNTSFSEDLQTAVSD